MRARLETKLRVVIATRYYRQLAILLKVCSVVSDPAAMGQWVTVARTPENIQFDANPCGLTVWFVGRAR